MSSSPRFNGRGNMMYKPNQPQFFKIILADYLRQKKLAIPRKFIKNYGNKLSDCVILKVPSGDNWKADIVKLDGQVWLEKGWHKFVECYSIVVGSLLVFRYDESISGFNVTIFDSTCSEIDYPYRHNNIINIEAAVAELKVPKVESDHDIPVEISGPFSPSKKRKEKSPLSSSPPHKKMKNVVENFTSITGEGTKSEATNENPRVSLEKQMVKRKMKEKSKDIYRASSSFPSQNPTFKTAIRPSHVYLEIPAKFVRKYMKKKDGDALFDVLNTRTWSVKYYTNTGSARTRTKLRCSSWKEFARGNHLAVGDVCKFELIDVDKTRFKVVIFRSGTGANAGIDTKAKKEHRSLQKQMVHKIVTSEKPYSTLKEKGKRIQRASSGFQYEIPTFHIAICPSHVHPRYHTDLDIPASFVRKYMTRKDGDVLLNVLYGRTWSVKYCTKLYCGVTRTQLMRSCWNEFAQDNHLQVGDVCKFKLIDPHKALFRVIISRSTTGENAASGSSIKKSKYKETSINIFRNTSSLNSTKAAEKFTSLNPFFQVALTSWHLKSLGVTVPRSFVKNMNQNETTQNVKLAVNGKMWSVKLLVYPNYGGKGKLCAGWAAFAREICLKAGDVCTFELIDTRELLIKVSISRD